MQSGITTCLWFDGRAEEAAAFYTAAFRAGGREASVGEVLRNPGPAPGPAGRVLLVPFTLHGQSFLALNGGPEFCFTPAVSLCVICDSQGELDRFWDLLGDGGRPDQCGWLTDRFGLSWQIFPAMLPRLAADPDTARGARVMTAMMGMTKLDIAALEAAYRGE
ncbi:VOC family protein [Roseomonas marmotae]|uniref:VOC family protein n=1 Tax=Roseomonas marmotae TaxID=2768161 RepID=A0ABS3KGP0_9PROT|nr:VOC family protein [Roseomonas marmotae]MBO1076642.1 VOC family protein [Roseomonas marmotae]QTI79617.1 VOC family protein [Roseomonas marmotae]